jgi:hypothetical protein
MAHISLTDSQRQERQHLARRGRDARVVRRAQGLLWLDQGEHPIAVAQRLGVTRESVYAWVRRLQHQGARSLVEKLMEQPRSGRPREKRHAGRNWCSRSWTSIPASMVTQRRAGPPPCCGTI